MADNAFPEATVVAAPLPFAFDDIGPGVLYPRTKLIHGADGVNAGDVSSANPLPVTGAVTNAGVFAIQVSTGLPAGTNNIGDVDVLTLPPITGTVAVSNFPVGFLSAQSGVWTVVATDGGGSITVDGTVSISGTVTVGAHEVSIAAAQTIAVTNAGTFLVQATLAAGTNNIGDVDILSIAAGDNNIGNVDIVTMPADPFGVNADAASATGSISAKLRFIASTGIPITGTVTVGSHAVTNAGIFVVQVDGAALTALQKIDDSIFVDDAVFTLTSSSVSMAGAIRDDALSTLGAAEGDAVCLRVSSTGALHVTGGGGGTEYAVDAALGATPTGSLAIAIRDDALSALTPVEGDAIGLRVGSTGALWVGVEGTVTVGSHAVTNVGTFAVQATQAGTWTVTGAAGTFPITDSGGSITTDTAGDVTHDAVDSGNPVKIGAKASTSLAGVTLVADADRTDLRAAADGAQLVRNYCLEDVVQDRAVNTDGVSTAFTSGLAAPGAGIRLWVKNVDIANTSAGMVTMDLRDGAAGAVLWTLPVPAGGCVKNFDPPLKLTANTALAFDASAATTTLTISANGFKSKI